MNDLFQFLSQLDPHWIYAVIFLMAYIENLFPPAPSDLIIVCGGALAAMEKGNFLFALVAGTVGSVLGFMTMYAVGKWFGRKILDRGKISFIKLETIRRIERWFNRYGYWLIVANRFLSGTRAVVSFFAGIAQLDFRRTLVLSALSSLVWYGILVYAGYSLGGNWNRIESYLASYGEVTTAVLIAVGIIAVVHFYLKRAKRQNVG